MSTFLKFDSNDTVINQWESDHKVEPSLFDATGRGDGPDYMGRTYDSATDTFSPVIVLPKSRRQLLKEKLVWTPADRDAALRELL